MRGTRKLALVGTAVSMGFGGAAAIQAPASADPCPSGALCAYELTNFAGHPGDVYGNNDNLLIYSAYDNAASVINNGRVCDVRIYDEPGANGDSLLLTLGAGRSNLRTSNPDFYHDIASNYWKCP